MCFAAFKIIREAYYQQLETRGDKTDPELSSWLEWREKNRPSKPLLVSVNRPPQSFSLSSGGRQGTVKTPAAAAAAASPAAAAPVLPPVSKQAVVLPTRPLPVTNTSTSITNSSVTSVKLPTSPVITGSGGVSSLPLGRTIATTTLTAAQLQQLAAARGQVFVSGLQTQVRAGAGQVAVAGGAGGVRQVTAQLARGGQIVRQGGQTSLIVSQQPRQALAVQRPLVSGQVVARSVRPPGQQIMVAASPRPGSGQQIMVGGRGVGGQLVMASAGQLRQGGVMVVTTTAGAASGGVIVQSSSSGATRQHYVISGSQAHGGQAQIVALQPGQNIRQGQIVQVSNKADIFLY